MEWSKWLSSAGLVLDIVGVLMLWHFGLPKTIDRQGRGFRWDHTKDEAAVKKAALYDGLAKIALTLIVCGFAMQLVGGLPQT